MRGVKDYWVIYYLVYVVSVIVLTVLNWRNFTADNYTYLLAAIFGASLGIALFVAIVSEGVGYMVLLIPRRIKELKDQGKKEGKEEGKKEGKKEERRKWKAWYRRQQEAMRAGLPFDELPPGSDSEDDSDE